MSDTNNMRREFEVWMLHTEKIIVGSSDSYPAGLERERWRVWQAATERATAPKWLLIETAPKDRNILLAAEFYGPSDWRIKIGGWADDAKRWELFGASWTPTHWMPLPPPPAIGQGGTA